MTRAQPLGPLQPGRPPSVIPVTLIHGSYTVTIGEAPWRCQACSQHSYRVRYFRSASTTLRALSLQMHGAAFLSRAWCNGTYQILACKLTQLRLKSTRGSSSCHTSRRWTRPCRGTKTQQQKQQKRHKR